MDNKPYRATVFIGGKLAHVTRRYNGKYNAQEAAWDWILDFAPYSPYKIKVYQTIKTKRQFYNKAALMALA